MRKGNIRILGIPERKEREQEAESLFKETVTENFPNLQVLVPFVEQLCLQYTSLLSHLILAASINQSLILILEFSGNYPSP